MRSGSLGRKLLVCGAISMLFASSMFILFSTQSGSGSSLLDPLENRFRLPEELPSAVDGIILAGGFHLDSKLEAEWPRLANHVSQRVTETARLAKLYSNAIVLYSGGGSEGARGKDVLVRLGVDEQRILLENESRTTAENASFAREVLRPGASSKWILVTSAYHMPRAVGVFRKAGFSIIPYPVDLRTDMSSESVLRPGAAIALREYAALLVYWLRGWSLELFPSPTSS
jgi:uncharacterized SAM-binding protein YcdF (DUF218 family)